MTFTSWPGVACTEISGGLGIACWPSGRRRRTTTVCAPVSRPRIATRNMRGCCAGRPLTLMLRKIPSRLTLPSCPTSAWSQRAARRISAVTPSCSRLSRHDADEAVRYDDDLDRLRAAQSRVHLLARERGLPERVLRRPGGQRQPIAHLAIDLDDDRHLGRRRELRVERRPRLTVHRIHAAAPMPQLLGDVR